MSSDKKPGFWQRLFGMGGEEPAKKEPPAPKPAQKEPGQKPIHKEPPERKKPPKKAEGSQAKKAAKLKAPPPAGPASGKEGEGPSDDGPKGPKPGGGKRPRKPKSEKSAGPPPAAPAVREGATPPDERAPGTREKGTPDHPAMPSAPITEPEKPEDEKSSKASAEGDAAPRRSWFAQLRSGLSRTSSALSDNLTSVLSRRKLDAETLDELEDALIKADLGVAMASRIRSALASTRHDRALSPIALREVLAAEVAKVLAPVAEPLVLDRSTHPHVILLVGVNGTGKTTTAAKLAHRFIRDGFSVMLAAGGTGGHLFPALALAQELGRRGIAVDLVTDKRADRYDGDFPARAIYRVPSATPTGKSVLGLGRAAMSLTGGVATSLALLRRVKPAAVVGFGGYPAFPPLVAARLSGLPTALHEQNAVLGRANRALAPYVTLIATSFERIHRSNLVMMGVLPLQFPDGHNADSLGLDGTETFDIDVDDNLSPRKNVTVTATKADGSTVGFDASARVDTPIEVEYLRNGGILHYVLRRMAAGGGG